MAVRTFLKSSILKFSASLLLSAVAMLAQSNPFIGKWEMSAAKSKFNPPPPLKSQTVTIGEDKVTVEGTDGTGKSFSWSYKVTPGAETPLEGIPGSVVETISGNTVDHEWKNPKGTSHGHGVISKDGKTMRYTDKGINSEGKKVNDLYVFEKQ
jgi:hypothetical protein